MKDFFISYNKADRQWAEWIAGVLEQARFSTILQAWDFRPGSNFILQMQQAASEARRTLAVLSPDYLKAIYTQPEWAAALAQDPTGEKGTLLPVRVRECEPKGLLSSIIYIDLVGLDEAAATDELVKGLQRGRVRPTGRPRFPQRAATDADAAPRFPGRIMMAPDVPAGFVARPAEFDQLLRLVLDEPHRPVAITTALHGSGGFGKTTLATALCHHERVLNTFTDGILWVTLGIQPNVLDALRKLYAALTGERPAFVDDEDASIHLANELDTRKCLIVIDDVWQSASLRPFMRGGQQCVRLITTRDFTIAASAQAQRVLVDEMRTDEAVQMLTTRLDEHPRQAEVWQALARRLGEWPLMLELARSRLQQQLARGATLEKALAFLNQSLDRHGVGAFDHREAADRHEAISRTIEVSLELLDSEKHERARYTELAIFPVAAGIPLPAIAALWGTDAFDTEELVTRLNDLSVLRFNLAEGSIRLHDVLRNYLASQLPDAAFTHKKLLRAWKDLYSLPDAYAWRWIGYHLVGANQKSVLSDLLFDLEWMMSKIAVTDVTALIGDYDYVDEPDARLVQGALRLMGHILAKDKTQLAGQLQGRLMPGILPRVDGLLEQAGRWKDGFWLRPRTTTLRPPGGPLIRTLIGHRGSVGGVSISSDGNRACSISGDQSIVVWDLNSGEMSAKHPAHGGVLTAMAGDALRSVSLLANGHSIEVWDIESQSLLYTLEGGRSWITAVAVTADGTRAISASYDRLLKIWDLNSGKLSHTLQVQGRAVSAVAMTPDGSRAIAALRDEASEGLAIRASSREQPSVINVWDVNSGKRLHTLAGHTDEITALAITPNGSRAISASLDKTLKVWDLDAGALLTSLSGLNSRVTAIAISADGRRALSASSGHALSFWDLRTGGMSYLRGHTGEITAVATSVDGNRAVSASTDRTLKVWDLNQEEIDFRSQPGMVVVDHLDVVEEVSPLQLSQQTIKGHGDAVTLTTRDDMLAVSASIDNTLKIWELDDGALFHTLRGNGSQVFAILLTPIGTRLISATTEGLPGSSTNQSTVLNFDLSTFDKPDDEPRTNTSTILDVWDLYRWTIGEWGTTETGACHRVSTLRGHRGRVTAVALTADGTRAISASSDRTARLWDVGTGQMLRTLVHSSEVLGVAMTPDGRLAVSAAADSSLRVWDLDRGKLSYTMDEKPSAFTSVAITPDGSRAVSSGNHGLTVWNLNTGEILYTIEVHSGGITAVAISQDGKRVASAFDDHSLTVWDLNSRSFVASFTSDAPLTSILMVGDSDIIAGDASGQVHFLSVAGAAILNH